MIDTLLAMMNRFMVDKTYRSEFQISMVDYVNDNWETLLDENEQIYDILDDVSYDMAFYDIGENKEPFLIPEEEIIKSIQQAIDDIQEIRKNHNP